MTIESCNSDVRDCLAQALQKKQMFCNDKKPITAYYQHTNNGHAMQVENTVSMYSVHQL